MKDSLNEDQVALIEESSVLPLNATIFPNTSLLHSSMSIEPGSRSVPYVTLRVWQPMGPGKTEVWSWCLVEKDAPGGIQESLQPLAPLDRPRRAPWNRTTRRTGAARPASPPGRCRLHYLNYSAGAGQVDSIPEGEWAGPGTAYPRTT